MAEKRWHPPALDLAIGQAHELLRWIQQTLFDLYGTDAQRAGDIDLKLRLFAANYDLPAMYRFWKWARAEQLKPPAEQVPPGLDDSFILTTIMHDLNGCERRDRFFAPRTESY